MRFHRAFFHALVFVLLFVVPAISNAQSYPSQVSADNTTGVRPYNPYGGVRENVGLSNGNLNLQIPLLSLPGRNGNNLDLSLEYDSKIWQLRAEVQEDGSIDYWWEYEKRDIGAGELGWRLNIPHIDTTWSEACYCPSNFVVTMPNGSKHSFQNQAGYINLTDSDDATFMTLDTSNQSDIILRMKDGTQIHFYALSGFASKIVDTNGNYITFELLPSYTMKLTDSLGREVTINSMGIYLNTPSGVTYKDSNGISRTISFTYSNVYIAPTFSLPINNALRKIYVHPFPPGNYSLLASVTLPNLRSYGFTYNTFGELTKIAYPTGGYTKYGFAANIHRWAVGPNETITRATFRELSERRVCREASGTCASEDVTTYTGTIPANWESNQFMDVRDPLGNRTQTEHWESSYFDTQGIKHYALREINRYEYSGETTLLRTTHTDYDVGGPAPWALPGVVTTTLNDSNQKSKIEWSYDTYTAWIVDSFGHLQAVTRNIDNPTEKREFHYGSGVVGALARRTVNSWLKVNPVNGQNYQNEILHIMDRKASEVICDGGATCTGTSIKAQAQFEYDNYTEGLSASGAVQHESAFNTAYTKRGNVTLSKRWRDTDGSWPETRNQYDDAGNVLKTTDPLTHPTLFSYVDSWGNASCPPPGGNAAAYVTTVTNALGHVTHSTYNSCAGTTASTTDPNNQMTTFTVYDAMNRLRQTDFPGGGQVLQTYNETSTPLSLTTTTKIDATKNLVSTAVVDGLGRVVQTQLNSDPQGIVYSDTIYDQLGRKATVTNPYRSTSDPTYGITTFNYDALSRTTKVIPPDGTTSVNNITTAYSGNTVTVTDQAGKQRRSYTDALGRLIQIDEPNPTLSMPAVTTYTYNTLDNLTNVLQSGSRQRTFTYNSLSQLLSATNPESGTISYTYDNDGNLLAKIDARSITTTHSYDALHRLTAKTYSNGNPPNYFWYDTALDGLGAQYTKGRLTKIETRPVSVATTATEYSYDAAGRIVTQWRCTPLNCGTSWFTLTYAYNLAGGMTSYTDGYFHTYTQTFNAAAQLTQLTSNLNDSQHPGTLTSGITYNAVGAVAQMIHGNGLYARVDMNNRLQPCRMRVNVAATSAVDCAATDPTGDILQFKYGYNAGTANNGNVMSSSAYGKQTFTRNYGYDALSRINTMTGTGGNCTSLSWTYDIWSNRLTQTGSGCTASTPTINTLNRIADPGYNYDAAGNMTADPATIATYTYDAENRMTASNSTLGNATYVYDANGRRVRKTVNSVSTEYIYDLAGNVITEKQGTTWTKGYVYLGGQLLAQYDNTVTPNTTYFAHKDHLGSTRLLTKIDQSTQECDGYQPFGELDTSVCTPVVGTASTTHKFTGKERDTESGLDFFGARYDSSSLGRFMTPDPGAYHVENPQSLNRYTYALNNPLFYIDPDGADSISAVYHLGTATVRTFVPTGQSIDIAGLLVSVRGGFQHLPLRGLKQSQPMATPRELDSGGGCVLGCMSTFSERAVGLTVSLSFNYDPDTNKLTGASIGIDNNPNSTFIGPYPPAQRAAFSPLPGMGPSPEVIGVNIDSSVLRKLSPEQIKALEREASSQQNSIYQQILRAVQQEQQRRAEEERKRQEEERKRKCQQDGNCG